MPQNFRYRARDLSGRLVRGTVEAESAGEVVAVLRERDIFPMEVRPVREYRLDWRKSLGFKVRARDMALFCRQFAVLSEAGVPLLPALRVLGQHTGNPTLKEILADVQAEVQKGKGLAEAFGRHERYLPEVFLSMVAVGEESGTLDLALERLAAHFEREAALYEKLKTATSYPLLVVGVAVVTIIALMLLVVPVFADTFRQMNAPLPLPTRILIGISDGLIHYWYLLLLGLAALFAGLRCFFRTPRGRDLYDRLLLRLPIVGSLVRKATVTRFAGTLATLLATGVPLLRALEITARTVGSAPARAELRAMEEGARRGERLSAVMGRGKFFPPLSQNMVAVGEESGNLDGLLTKLGAFYEQEVAATIERFSTMVEPVLIIGVGLVVVFIAISIYLPIFGLGSALQHGAMAGGM